MILRSNILFMLSKNISLLLPPSDSLVSQISRTARGSGLGVLILLLLLWVWDLMVARINQDTRKYDIIL